jgi:hypothetical protein
MDLCLKEMLSAVAAFLTSQREAAAFQIMKQVAEAGGFWI